MLYILLFINSFSFEDSPQQTAGNLLPNGSASHLGKDFTFSVTCGMVVTDGRRCRL